MNTCLRLRFVIAVIGVALSLLLIGVAQAKPVVVHVKFHRQGPAQNVMTNGRYVLLEAPAGGAPVLIDEQAGRRAHLPACANAALGFVGPYLEWHGCTSAGTLVGSLRLYRLGTGKTTTLGSDSTCDPYQSVCSQLGPAGTSWLSIADYDVQEGFAGGDLINRVTGKAYNGGFGPAPGAVVNYDAPNLVHKVCRPLYSGVHAKLGKRSESQVTDWIFGGDYGYYGSGITAGALPTGAYQNSGAWLGGFAVGFDINGTPYLGHCGTHMARRLWTVPASAYDASRTATDPSAGFAGFENGDFFTGDSSALLLLNKTTAPRTELPGIFLPSLRKFTLALPTALQDPATQFVLTRRTLWAVTPNGETWTARAPTRPRAR